MTRGGSGNDPRHTFEQKNIEGCPSTGAVPLFLVWIIMTIFVINSIE